MDYDDILEELGELGLWQVLHLFLLWIPAAGNAMWLITYSFSGLYKTLYKIYLVNRIIS